MINPGERKGRTIGLKYMALHSCSYTRAPAITTRQSTQNKKAHLG